MTLILSGTNGLSDVDGDASTPAIRGSDSNTGIFFGTDIIGFSEGGTEAMRINADAQIVAAAGTASLPVITTTGDVNTGIFFPAADTIAFTTGGTTRGRWTTDGLCFNADTAAANALDDYEEGSWTPVAVGTTTAGTGTYSPQQGRYTKIGRVCYFQMTLGWSAHTGTGNIFFTGLPFTSLASFQGQSAATLGYNGGLSFTNQPILYIGANATSINPTQTTTAGVVTPIPMDTSVGELIISGNYIVA
jgi:hypothetical protein